MDKRAKLDKELEAKVDRRVAKTAKELKGHIHINRPICENVPMQILGSEFKKSARRKVN